MQFTTVFATIFAATAALAAPATNEARQAAPYIPCRSTIYSEPKCCSANLLEDTIGVDCQNPNQASFRNVDDFEAACEDDQGSAYCCLLAPLIGLGPICQPALGRN